MMLRVAGSLLLLLAAAHVPIGRRLNWREEALRLSPANGAIVQVHTLFICLILVLMGLPCLADPGIFVEKTRAGMWLTWSFSAFWTTRLVVQWMVFPHQLWRGKQTETRLHLAFTALWLFLAILFAFCAARQMA